MSNYGFCPLCDIDWLTIIISAFVSIIWTFLSFIFIFRPALEIKLKKDPNRYLKKSIDVEIINHGECNAVNLKIEICGLDKFNNTYHFEVAKDDFIMLPPKKVNSDSHKRVFTAYKLSGFTELIMGRNDVPITDFMTEKGIVKIRARVHANHSLTGFGKAFEKYFYNVEVLNGKISFTE